MILDSLEEKIVYFQMMWGFLGQESFPLSEDEYKNR